MSASKAPPPLQGLQRGLPGAGGVGAAIGVDALDGRATGGETLGGAAIPPDSIYPYGIPPAPEPPPVDIPASIARNNTAADNLKQLLFQASPDVVLAFRILYCIEQPQGNYTRDWAINTVREIAAGMEMANLFLAALGGKLSHHDRDFILSRMPRSEKVEMSGELGLKALIAKIDGKTRGLPAERGGWPDEHVYEAENG